MKYIHPTFTVSDVEATLKFYTEVLGFTTEFTMDGPDGKMVHASVTRGVASIMFGTPRDALEKPWGRGVALYFTVEDEVDIDAFFEQVKATGVPITQEPTDQFWGHRDFGITDPDGYELTISKVVGEFVDPAEFAKNRERELAPAD